MGVERNGQLASAACALLSEHSRSKPAKASPQAPHDSRIKMHNTRDRMYHRKGWSKTSQQPCTHSSLRRRWTYGDGAYARTRAHHRWTRCCNTHTAQTEHLQSREALGRGLCQSVTIRLPHDQSIPTSSRLPRIQQSRLGRAACDGKRRPAGNSGCGGGGSLSVWPIQAVLHGGLDAERFVKPYDSKR